MQKFKVKIKRLFAASCGELNPLEIKKGLQQSQSMTGFSTGSKSQPFDNKLPHGTFLGQTSEGVAAYSNDSADSLALEPCRVGNTVTGLP
jgi:hypothetical protein